MWVLYKLLAAASSDVMSGGKRVIYSSSSVVVVLMIILLILQIWVCCDCQAGAIRIFPTSNETEKKESSRSSMVTTNRSYKEGDLVHKYFGGSAFNFNRTDKGLADDKRRVPSCPDPLHN